MKRKFTLLMLVFAFFGYLNAQDCDTIRNLNATLHSPGWYDVNLSWQAPATAPIPTILTWGADVQYDGIGTGGAEDFYVAHRFIPADLTAHDGKTIEQVAFIPIEEQCTYSIRIWTGGTIAGPDMLIVDQQLNNNDLTFDAWNTITLSTPVVINASEELWIGIRCNTTTGYPAACDAGPPVSGKGNMMYFDGAWDILTNIAASLTYNWCIQGIIPAQDGGNGTVVGYKIVRNSTILDTVNTLGYTDNVPVGTYTYDIAALWTSGCTETYKTVQINMEADPCESPVTIYPYLCSFDSVLQNNCWSIYDVNNDGYTFTIDASNGNAYYRWNTNEDANDWLESPIFTLTGNQYLSFEYKVGSASYPEKFSVLLVSDTDTTTIFPTMEITNSTYLSEVINLSNYSGDYKIAFIAESDADEYYLYFDNVLVDNIPSPSIQVNKDTIDFGLWATGTTSYREQVIVTGWSLVSDITVNVSAPFQVSLDGVNFSSSVVIPTITSDFYYHDTLYFNYTALVAGTDATDATLTNPDATTITIHLMGEALDCETITQYPYYCNFNPQTSETICWSIADVDGDGDDGYGEFSFMAFNSTNPGCAVYFASEDSTVVNANDWLISPEFFIAEPFMYASFEYLVSEDIDWDLWDYVPVPQTFSVWIIPDGSTYADVTTPVIPTQTVSNVDFSTLYIDLIPYANQKIQIGIKVETPTSVGGYFVVDSFVVREVPDPEITVTPDSLYFVVPAGSISSPQQVSINAWALTENITATVRSPFEISADGITYDTIATINFQPIYTDATLFVRFSPAVSGIYIDSVIFFSTGVTASVFLMGEAVDCSAEDLPFSESFDNEIPVCWLNIDADGDGYEWTHIPSDLFTPHTGDGCVASASYINYFGALYPENWLISPPINIPAAGANLTWWVASQDASYPREYYEVKISTNGWDLNEFSTTLFSETLNTATWKQKYVDLANFAGQTIHVAFVHKNSSDEFWMKLDDVNVEEGVGIEQQTIENSVSIFPNPTNDVLNVYANNFKKVEVINFLGQVVYTNSVTDNQFQINVSSFSPGIYFIRLTGDQTVTKKFIKE